MSNGGEGLYGWLEKEWERTRKYNPAAPLFEKTMQTDSQNISRIADKLGWDGLRDEGTRNADDPKRGLARAAVMAGSILAGNWLGGGAGAGSQAPASSGAIANAGMFGTDAAFQGMATATQEQLAQQAMQRVAAEEAAKAAAANTLSGSAGGMFSQVPGVASNSQQAAMLNAQTGMFGGQGADLTAQSAMPAVKDAYQAGRMGTMDYAGNVAKSDLAGMNDPRVWLDRLGRNASRISGNKGTQQMALKMLAPQQQPQPSGFRAPPGKLPEQTTSGGDPKLRDLAQKLGIPEEELKRLLAQRGMA